MKVRYVGPHEAVDVPLPNSVTGAEATVARGDVLDTTADHAQSLAEQDIWELVEAAPKSKTTTTKPEG